MGLFKKRILQGVVTLIILALGMLAFMEITARKPQLKRRPPPPALPTVQVTRARLKTLKVTISGEGTVIPLREIQLVPQVSGKVIFVSSHLNRGDRFHQGEVLLRIDPIDYQLALTLAQARVSDAESKLQIAEQEAAVARQEWRLLYSDESKQSGPPPPLVAKEPQLAAARARLEAERADLQKARLNLERTTIRAPFDSIVSEERIDTGQYVTTGQPLATLFSTESAEIVVPLEDEALFWIDVPGFTSGSGPGSEVTVSARLAGQDRTWKGRVVRSEGKLDERTRMVNVVVGVQRPYDRKPPLAAGLFVAVAIKGHSLTRAARIPRAALHGGNTVWIVKDVVDGRGQLNFRGITVARLEDQSVIVNAGLEEGEQVVVSHLKAVTDGMLVRVIPYSAQPDASKPPLPENKRLKTDPQRPAS